LTLTSAIGDTLFGGLRARGLYSIFNLLRSTKSEGTCASSEQTVGAVIINTTSPLNQLIGVLSILKILSPSFHHLSPLFLIPIIHIELYPIVSASRPSYRR
jgi:hypothetical protein